MASNINPGPPRPTSPSFDLCSLSLDKITTTSLKGTPTSEIFQDGEEPFPAPRSSDQPLSFWQRHFCRPVDSDPEKQFDKTNRKFSLKSKGSMFAAITLLLVLCIMLAPAIAVTIDRRDHSNHHSSDHSNHHFNDTGGFSIPTLTAATAYDPTPDSPISQAIAANFADPWIMQYDDLWYAFATNDGVGVTGNPRNSSTLAFNGKNVQIATSSDFSNWTVLGDWSVPLPDVGTWSDTGNSSTYPYGPKASVWAPSVLQRPSDGKFVMYYAAKAEGQGATHCLGAALSDTTSPAGPYTANNISFACPLAEGGAIDASPFVDTDDSVSVVYKIDGNSRGNGGECGNSIVPIHSTPIMLQAVESDGMTPTGSPVEILDRIAADGPLVEAPSLVKTNGTYFLFYSSGCTRDSTYALKYAYSDSLTGPYTRAVGALLATGDYNLTAPGSATVTQTSDGNWVLAFHARVKTEYGGLREMFTGGVQFNGTNVTIVGASV